MNTTNGVDAATLFSESGLTYDDFVLLPGYIKSGLGEISLETRLTRQLSLKIPVVSSPMDTVTESRMAIRIALLGGIGIIHYNNTIEEQAEEVRKTKRFENGFIMDPVVLSPKHRIGDVRDIKRRYGFSGIPITQDGEAGGKLVGIVTSRDIDFERDNNKLLEDVMTTDLVTARAGIGLAEGNRILHESKKGKLPVVDENGNLVCLMSRTDLRKNQDFPLASKDEGKQLLVGAAAGTRDEDRDRLDALVEAGADVVVFDSAQGYSVYQVEMIKWAKQRYPDLPVIGGNVVTGDQCDGLIAAGADGLRVGMGSGSICITQETVAVGRSQASAVYYSAHAAAKHGVPVIADGGVRNSGDVPKALAAGADSVMLGSVLAGTEESPGEKIIHQGRQYVVYRGMGSLAALREAEGSRQRYAQDGIRAEELVPQGIEGIVPYAGTVKKVMNQFCGGLCSAMGYCGCRNIAALQEHARFIRVSLAGLREGHPHDVKIMKDAPNYRS